MLFFCKKYNAKWCFVPKFWILIWNNCKSHKSVILRKIIRYQPIYKCKLFISMFLKFNNLFVAFPIFQDMRHFWPESLDSSNRQNSSADPKRSKRSRLKPTSSWNGQSNIFVMYENKSFTWWNCDNLVAIRVFIELSVLFNFKLDSAGDWGTALLRS